MPSPLPPDHRERATTRRRFGRRERWVVAVMTLVTAAVVVVAVAALTSTDHPRRGCLDASVPGPIGATSFTQCGADARYLCAHLGTSQDLNEFGVSILAADCRRAGLPVAHGS